MCVKIVLLYPKVSMAKSTRFIEAIENGTNKAANKIQHGANLGYDSKERKEKKKEKKTETTRSHVGYAVVYTDVNERLLSKEFQHTA